MKRLIAIVLLLVTILGLCACAGGSGDKSEGGGGNSPLDGIFSMGYSIVNITPMSYSVPLAGYGNTDKRMSNGLYSFLYTTCVVFTDKNGNSVMIFQNDLAGCNNNVMDPIREEICKKIDIPKGNIMIAGTHTHSAPDMGSNVPSMNTYRADISKWMVQAAQEAWADRTEVTKLTNGRIQLPANTLNFTRHYTLKNGAVKGDNFGDLIDSPITGHVRDADSEMQVIRFERKGDAKPISMINWQTHPHRGGGGKDLNMTADLVGAMRDKYQKVTGDLFIYFTGAAGNVNPSSRIAEENITKDFKEQGEALADYALDCFNDNMVEADLGAVEMVAYDFEANINHAEDDKVEGARLVQNEWTTNNNFINAVKLANKYDINSPYHAGAIIRKAQLGDTGNINLNVFCVGDAIGFVTAPYEMFSEQGEFIKENSPYEHTIVITCCNGGVGYLASHEGYKNNCYGANTSNWAEGTAEALADKYVELLKNMRNG